MKSKTHLLIFVIMLSHLCKSQNFCNLASLPIDYYFYAGPASNFTYTGNSPTCLYLCNNALVYDTVLPSWPSDRTVMIESGAKYVWKRCGMMASAIFIKTGGTLTLLPDYIFNATTIYKEPGATINYSTGSAAADTIACSSFIFPSINCATGLGHLTSEKIISLFPNPTQNVLSIRLPAPYSDGVKIFSISDALGKHVLEGSFDAPPVEIETAKLMPGLYQIKISSKYGIVVGNL